MDQILNEEELIEYQQFLDGKIIITKFDDEYTDDTEFTILCYKEKCYNIYNGEISNKKQMNRNFAKAILSKNCWIKNLDVELIIEKYKGKILNLVHETYLYINDNLIFIEGFEKVSLINYITSVHEQSFYYDTISDKNIVDLNDSSSIRGDEKLDPIKEVDEEDDEIERILKEL